MDLLSHKIDKSSLKIGDHIYTYRNLHTCTIHGIYVENDRVIYYKSKNNKSKYSGNCERCGYNPTRSRGVVKSCLECFLQGHGLYLFQYGVSDTHCFIWRSGTCDTGLQIEHRPTIVNNAMEMLKESESSRLMLNNDLINGCYDFFDKNNMCFALTCTKTNRNIATCIQEISALSKLRVLVLGWHVVRLFSNSPIDQILAIIKLLELINK
ncbi:protein LEAD-SENSITIVE 1-like [Cannabis sativa]|uniref:protein LEAD-SENSITIVE 1-like n=1 Tax=Cannabis sativa TaxID=3483 RepID=UPI0029C9F98E|nr:protein LEAD-SENSITIVE 1-like [Cannabis sativa]